MINGSFAVLIEFWKYLRAWCNARPSIKGREGACDDSEDEEEESGMVNVT